MHAIRCTGGGARAAFRADTGVGVAPDPLVPGGKTHARIALVQVMAPMTSDQQAIEVAWYCKPKTPVDAALRTTGLPVDGFKPDTTLRMSKCWGRYEAQDPSSYHEGAFNLPINLGSGDGLKPGDELEVLGKAHTDEANRAITGFDVLGICKVEPFKVTIDHAECRLDTYSAKGFDQTWWSRGGFIHLVQPEAPKGP